MVQNILLNVPGVRHHVTQQQLSSSVLLNSNAVSWALLLLGRWTS